MVQRSHDTGVQETKGREVGLTRRQFAGRAGAAAGSLAAGSVLLRAVGASAGPAPSTDVFSPEQIAVLSALLETLLAPAPPSSPAPAAMINAGLQQLAEVYVGYSTPIQQTLLASLSVTQASAPGGSFTTLPIAARETFIDTYALPPVQTATFLQLAGMGFSSLLQAVLDPVLATLTPVDPSQLEPADELPPAPEPPPPSLSPTQTVALAVLALVDFALLAYGPLPPPVTEPD